VTGLDTREHGPGELAARVGSLFQDPETQIVMGSVRAELAFPLENRGMGSAAVARAVEETALALGIAHLLDRGTADLSGGECQRVALGAALAGRPALLVLDEPTAQLDPVAGDDLLGTLRRLNDDLDTAVVLADHRLERCLTAADRVVALAGGRIACDATPGEFLDWAARHAPDLQTPGAQLLATAGLSAVPGVRAARRVLRGEGLLPSEADSEPGFVPARRRDRLRGRRPDAVAAADAVWHEPVGAPPILRGLTLAVETGERVALMGRNGAGKSTLLRHLAGLMRPTRGRVTASGRVALLLQNPGDYLVHESVAEEASEAARLAAGLGGVAGARHPRDLSGGERQRLALAAVLDDPEGLPALLCLDEPTRGMDRRRRDGLATLLRDVGCPVLVATHDPEFVAAFATRVVLLADGTVIADGRPADVLARGTYFATEVARILGGAGGALTAAEGAAVLGVHRRPEVTA
jgi:energy-coupling factor transport system ATP-binding protein